MTEQKTPKRTGIYVDKMKSDFILDAEVDQLISDDVNTDMQSRIRIKMI